MATPPSSPPAAVAHPWDRLTQRQRILGGFVLAFSNLMVVLDLTIANVSVPHIAGDVGVSLNQGTWLITSYAVAEAICVPLTGWLAARFGAVRLFLVALAGFGLFSLLCGLSITLGMIIFARIGQGLCGGPLMPMTQTLITRVFPPQQRAAAMGLWAMTTIVGPALGPILGGFITDNYTWHWVFFINVPLVVPVVMAGYALLRPIETERRAATIDRVGLALLIFWIACLQIMLDIGRDHDWFGDPLIVALGLAAFIGFLVFCIWELTDANPVVDLKVLRHRGFSATVAAQALSYGAYFAGIVVIPQWLQGTLGYTATNSGFISAMNAISALMVARFVAGWSNKVDPRKLISFGVLWMAATTLVRLRWTSGVDFFGLAWPMFILGFGVPFMFIPSSLMALSAVDVEETASAAGLQAFARTMAGAIATSLVLTIWDDKQSATQTILAARLNPQATQAALAGIGMGPQQTSAYIARLVNTEVVTVAVLHTFFIATIVLLISAAIVWLVPRIPLTRLSGDGPVGH